MKTIVLFSRLGLTDLFGSISKKLENYYSVVHIAYGEKEARKLREKYNVKVKLVFDKEIELLYKTANISQINDLDADYRKYTKGRFNLYSAVISDRGMGVLSYEESMKLSVAYYRFWIEFFNKYSPSVIFHETTSLLFNHMCAIVSKKYDAIYSGFIATMGTTGRKYMFVEYDDGCSMLMTNRYNSLSESDCNKYRELIEGFKKRINRSKAKLSTYRNIGIGKELVKVPWLALYHTYELYKLGGLSPIYNNVDYYMLRDNKRLNKSVNRIRYKLSDIYDEIQKDDKYYYYPLHLEPEAVVQYWSGGKYNNQVALIEQLSRSIPIGTVLYVKDHVDNVGYRAIGDYQAINRFVNVKLISPEIDSIELIKGSKGVITINGTAGFEALILNKPVYLLGSVYYKVFKYVNRVKNIEELEKMLASEKPIGYTNPEYAAEIDKLILAYLSSGNEGDISQYFTSKDISRKGYDMAAGFQSYLDAILIA